LQALFAIYAQMVGRSAPSEGLSTVARKDVRGKMMRLKASSLHALNRRIPLPSGIATSRPAKARSVVVPIVSLAGTTRDMPADLCSKHKVEVEFIDSHGNSVSRVEFTFEAGRVVSADCWERSFETGRSQGPRIHVDNDCFCPITVIANSTMSDMP